MMKFYIAGPVSGQPNHNAEAFNSVADQITDSGNAALYTSLLPKGMSEPEYMKFAHAMLEVCDVVVLLPRWSMSEGATAEFHWAVKLGKKIVRQEHLPVLLRYWFCTERRDCLLNSATKEVRDMVSGVRSIY
ncbi:DUF4406 domain-containing protein [Vibrio europaeus]|uniref:DUF4406 domain-containing protein n=1 Tax=Vibrio europaeus TaxID=300876 RepID=A0ABT5GMX1_9VIBR|nr:DUF4406 domain-containing protein [Vibrio europaeus]MDC5723111.1 DUF4406 domain-containing protein [Vibrio europaeus]MDC5728068.1 DUF4406 domain-containing protein [Vibrio europaeus]MDC5733371.1 DUF4406 domain-containing protein [Vibrio europaeus]MDC5738590.1 DUF4406 domain-containing protein [Vibrio europaeus]MDC5743848.1 DUF4406 domain-containing protein [Vibrio europaeus]